MPFRDTSTCLPKAGDFVIVFSTAAFYLATVLTKSVCYVLILSMTLHCASRLGFIDYVYNQRNAISAAIGLIDEVPITLCGSRYEHPKTFKLDNRKEQQSLPVTYFKTQVINLFFVSAHSVQNVATISVLDHGTDYIPDLYTFSLSTSVFHPPAA